MGRELHTILTRQVARAGLGADQLPTDTATWAAFLSWISRAYQDADEERYTSERAQDRSATELAAMREQAVQERDKLHSVLSALHVAVIDLDPAGHVAFANPAAVALFGAEPRGRELSGWLTLLDGNGVPVAPAGQLEQPDGAVQVERGPMISAVWSVSPLPGERGDTSSPSPTRATRSGSSRS